MTKNHSFLFFGVLAAILFFSIGAGCQMVDQGDPHVSVLESGDGGASGEKQSNNNSSEEGENVGKVGEVDDDVSRNLLEDTEPTSEQLVERYQNDQLNILWNGSSKGGLTRVTIATDESGETYCGSFYSLSDCYFFLEKNDGDVGSEPEYLGALVHRDGAINFDTIEFIGEAHVRFETGDGDAGCFSQSYWNIDLMTKKKTLLDEHSGCMHDDVDKVTFPR